MLHVIATITVAPGTRNEFLQEFHKLVPQVHAEEGCIEYGPTVDVDAKLGRPAALRENVVVVVEKWESAAALQAHMNAPHVAAYRERVKHIVQSVEIQVLQPA